MTWQQITALVNVDEPMMALINPSVTVELSNKAGETYEFTTGLDSGTIDDLEATLAAGEEAWAQMHFSEFGLGAGLGEVVTGERPFAGEGD